jgi:hypothetical protein
MIQPRINCASSEWSRTLEAHAHKLASDGHLSLQSISALASSMESFRVTSLGTQLKRDKSGIILSTKLSPVNRLTKQFQRRGAVEARNWGCTSMLLSLCGNRKEEREGCCIEGATASDYIHKRAE